VSRLLALPMDYRRITVSKGRVFASDFECVRACGG
jgi:hypothetical protein